MVNAIHMDQGAAVNPQTEPSISSEHIQGIDQSARCYPSTCWNPSTRWRGHTI